MSASDGVAGAGLARPPQSSRFFPSEVFSLEPSESHGGDPDELKVEGGKDPNRRESDPGCDRPKLLRHLSHVLCANGVCDSFSALRGITQHAGRDSRNPGIVDPASMPFGSNVSPPTAPASFLPFFPPPESSRGSWLIGVAFGSSVWWGWRSLRTVEKELGRRYADIAYQIRRPDALNNRIIAFKYLVGGGLAIPLLTLGACVADSIRRKASPATETVEKMCDTPRGVETQQCECEEKPTASVPAIKNLPSSWELFLRERFIMVVMPQQEAWRQWATTARQGHSTAPQSSSNRFREGGSG
uniref:Uncharacterized protein n=1 Tax=Neospora caninum (strain Liverpool) TaxID=572307 RepID=F0JB28_NEOCL|nr:hypothetical protein, conserved [Neospora caninum Liverpool]CEL71294.1 TPA: hypothetical protein, conserved [Neospora caninum Liverpool]